MSCYLQLIPTITVRVGSASSQFSICFSLSSKASSDVVWQATPCKMMGCMNRQLTVICFLLVLIVVIEKWVKYLEVLVTNSLCTVCEWQDGFCAFTSIHHFAWLFLMVPTVPPQREDWFQWCCGCFTGRTIEHGSKFYTFCGGEDQLLVIAFSLPASGNCDYGKSYNIVVF